MKASIRDFAGGTNFENHNLNYRQNQEIDPEKIFEIAKEIFDSGLNVMILHQAGFPPSFVLFVDTLRFQQR